MNNSSVELPATEQAELDHLLDQLDSLVFRMGRLMTSRHGRDTGGSGLKPPQYMLLRMLDAEGPARVASIAASLGVKSPAISMLIQGLEERGLVAREHDAEDRRAINVSLTQEGVALARRAEEFRRVLMREYTSTLTMEELRQLIRIQTKLADAMASGCD
jgi:DNA-binding MarR family transcriptional regulator